MAFPNETVGTQVSAMPTGYPALKEQTEANDPITEDPDLAEGRDANSWSAEIQAIARALGNSPRALIKINDPTGPPTADIGDLKLALDGSLLTIVGGTAVPLTPGVTNYFFVDFNGPPAMTVSTTPFVLTDKILPLATWDGAAMAVEASDLRSDMPAPQALFLGADAPATSGLDGQDIIARPGKGDGAGRHGGLEVSHKEFGGSMRLQPVNVLLSGSGASLVAPGAMPPGMMIMGATVYIVGGDLGGGGATGMDVGLSVDPTAYAAAMPVAPTGTTAAMDASGTGVSPVTNHGPGPIDVVLTAIGGTFDSISVRVVLWAYVWSPPTS